MTRSRSIILAALAALALAAAGCGSSSSAGSGSTGSNSANATSKSCHGIPQHNGGDIDADNNGCGPDDGDGGI